MSYFPKPFFRKSLGQWYVQVRGKQINLGPDKDAPSEEAPRLMGAKEAPVSTAPADLAVAIVDQFLGRV